MVRYTWDEGVKKYISSEGQIMGGGTAYKTDDGKWSLTKPQNSSSSSTNSGVSSNTNSMVTNPTTSSSSSNNTSLGLDKKFDVYGDVSGVSQNVGAKDYSSYTKTDLGELSRYGESAKAMERAKAGSISQRNDIIAGNLYTDKKYGEQDVRDFLTQQAGFNEAPENERENTVRAITERLKAIQEEEEAKKNRYGSDLTLQNLGDKDINAEGKAGYYNTKDGYVKIYGYDEFDEETKNLVDRLDDTKKKYVSNLWASGMQEDLKYYLDTMRAKDQAQARQDINQDLYDINRESSVIQAEQTLRNAEESYNNLQQNWQYLGNLGMPGVSSVKMKAIGDAIGEAKKTLGEIKRLTQLSLDAQEKQWEGEVLQYNQQIDNLMYNLKWQVGDEITNALSKYTTAELEGQLDTIDGITAFRKELLDDLDNNLSGLTSASLNQMQWINQQYQDIANRMYDYVQNANTVNMDMSNVKGFYVDGNGNPILNNQGEPIQVPQSAPIDPIFDKETGRLITFGLDDNGNIVASVQQVYPGDSNVLQSTIVSLLEQGVSVQDILKYVPDADLSMVQKLAQIVKPVGGSGGGYSSYTWQGKNYTPVSNERLKSAYTEIFNKYTKDGKAKDVWGGQCGHFVNDYLEKLGIGRLFTDPITEKTKNINSDVPKVGSVVIMNSESKPQYGHVGIVVGYKNGKISILQSNKAGEEHVFISTKSIDDGNILGYFDPTKSIEEFNGEIGSALYQAQGLNKNGFKDLMTGYYDKFLAGKFTTEDTNTYYNSQFEQELDNYKKFKESQVADATVNMLRALYNLRDMGVIDYNMAWLKVPKTDGYTKRRNFENYISNTTLQKLIESKKSGATFGALSDAELGILMDAATVLDFKMSRSDFNSEVNRLIQEMEQGLRDVGRSDLIVDSKNKAESSGGGKKKVSGGVVS